MVSRRVQTVSPSQTVLLSNTVANLKAQGKKIYNFGIGEPDFTTPEPIITYSAEKAKSGMTHYTPSKGIRELRNKIAETFTKRYSKISAENILVTPTKFAINLTVMVLCDQGDEIIIPEPYYLSYPDICRIYGVKPVFVKSNEDYSLKMDLIEEQINPRTRAILISNPCNPTGKVFSPSEIRSLNELCRKHGITFVCDIIYEDMVYKGEFLSPTKLDPELKNTVILSGFSKSFAMTGWRIGYMIASKEIIDAADTFQQQTITCAPSIAQEAAIYALEHEELSTPMIDEFRKRREIVIAEIKKIPQISLVEPEGAFYIFPRYNINVKSSELCVDILNHTGVSIIPGSVFGEQGEYHFRLSYAAGEQELREGIGKLAEYFRTYGKDSS